MLISIAPDLWVADAPKPAFGSMMQKRMTVVRSPGSRQLLVHSPIPPEPELTEALDALGEVKWIVAPNRLHHLSVNAFAERYPNARTWAVPGLAKRVKRLRVDETLSARSLDAAELGVSIDLALWAPMLNEAVLFHEPSRTLVVTDLLMNIKTMDRRPVGLMMRAMGAVGGLCSMPGLGLLTKDRIAARRSVDSWLELQPQRLIMSHGEVVTEDAQDALREVFAWL